MFITDAEWKKLTKREVWEILRMSAALSGAWNKETAYPKDQSRWHEGVPSIGQCAVTSLLVQNRLGGKIHRNDAFHHYWNEMPSGALVDFTHEQFKIADPISSEGVVSRDLLISGKGASEARTKERYKVLRRRVKGQLAAVKPVVYLLSSNAEAEYIRDIVETIGTPTGYVHHFRYKLKYIHRALRKLLPLAEETGKNVLVGSNVVAIYLRQKQVAPGRDQWVGSMPTRQGILRRCYRTGDSDNSIAHFYFEVRESLLWSDSSQDPLRNIFGASFEHDYALISFEPISHQFSIHKTSEIFESQCEALAVVGFPYDRYDRKTDTTKTIDYIPPLIVLVEGIFKRKVFGRQDELKLDYARLSMKSYYHLTEGGYYFLRLRTYNCEHHQPYQLKARVVKELFVTPEEYTLAVNSSYDGECWEFIPSFVQQKTCGLLKISTESQKNNNALLAIPSLDGTLLLPFRLNRRGAVIWMDTASDLLFALGPVYLAATKLLEGIDPKPFLISQWPYILLGIYIPWFVLKLVRRGLRGG